ncbi:MAG: carbon monoxide dehydrogenase, partial [Candidatus Omnitrophica bacterium]|nr:carbon monoxide dehydrogenase [Candidatus Omnitrophota bacterium]
YIAANRLGSLLAVDADPNSTLADMLGLKIGETMVGVVDETSKMKDAIPAGMSKDRFIGMKVQESIAEADNFDLLSMGRPEGPGCYCYMNSVLRNVLNDVTKNYSFLVVDNAAGMEHISRRTERVIDRLLLVSDYSIMGIRSAARIASLAKEMDIKVGRSFLIVNKITSSLNSLKNEIDASGIPLAGTIPYDEELIGLSLENMPISKLKSGNVKTAMADIMKKILG